MRRLQVRHSPGGGSEERSVRRRMSESVVSWGLRTSLFHPKAFGHIDQCSISDKAQSNYIQLIDFVYLRTFRLREGLIQAQDNY